MYRTLLKQTGGLLILVSIVMVTPIIVSLIYSEWYSGLGFLISSAVTMAAGLSLYRGFFFQSPEPQNSHALIIAALGWLVIAVFGSLPFLVIAYITPTEVMEGLVPAGEEYSSSLLYFKNPLHALFEGMSAFTTTGLTMAVHEPSVGKGILFYRSIAQWVGGAGFIVMALAVLQQMSGKGAVLLYGSESSGEKLKPNVVATARAIWKIYLGLTLFVAVYLCIGTYILLPDYPLGEIIFDSINHAMTGQSTGGFSTLDDSIAGYNSVGMDALYLLPMMLGAFSIPFYYKLIKDRKPGVIWNDIQTRSLLLAFVVGSGIMTLLLSQGNIVSDPIREGCFQFISALSTTGWQTSDIGAWDETSVAFIVVAAMLIGGAAGATVGGIKVVRVLLIQKGILWIVNKNFQSEKTIKTARFNHRILLPEEMNRQLAQASLFAFIYLVLVFASTMVTSFFMADGYTLGDAFFEAASAQGTVGLSTGITEPSMPAAIEVTYIIQMWAGRLEIIPIIVLGRAILMGSKPRSV